MQPGRKIKKLPVYPAQTDNNSDGIPAMGELFLYQIYQKKQEERIRSTRYRIRGVDSQDKKFFITKIQKVVKTFGEKIY